MVHAQIEEMVSFWNSMITIANITRWSFSQYTLELSDMLDRYIYLIFSSTKDVNLLQT